jgi:hypothetical protein
MFKDATLALYQLKRQIEAIPDRQIRATLLSECERMHHYMMSACMLHNESKNFMLRSPLGLIQQGNYYGNVTDCRTNTQCTAA